MIDIKTILEAAGTIKAKANEIHVETQGSKYKIHAVGSTFGHSEENPHGLEVGHHINDTEYESLQDSGAKIRHVKPAKVKTNEDVEAVDEASQAYRDAMAAHDSAARENRLGQAKDRLAAKAAEPKTLVQKIKKDIGTPLKHLMKGNLKKAITEGAEAHAQFQQYHNDSAKLLKGIGSALSKHYDNVTNKKGYNGGEAHWGHVGDVKEIHRNLQDLHDRILQAGEYAKPVKLGEEVEPEADMNILVQLRKPIDILEHGTQGGADITFGDGQKVFVEGTVAQKLVESMEKIKPEDRVKVAEFLYQSHDNLMAVYARLK